jgi:hypothetical protein
MGKAASICGVYLLIYLIGSRGQLKRDGLPSLGLGVELNAPHRKEQYCYEMFKKASELYGFFCFLWVRDFISDIKEGT